jgi:hypothetical protein
MKREKKKKGGIHIKPSHEGLFTAKAKARDTSVPALANRVMANPGDFSSETRAQANFAKNARKFKH